MPGILDYLTDNNGAASPWGALYQGQEPRLGFSWTGGFSPWADPAQLSVAAPAAVNPPGIPANDPWGMLYPSPLLDPKTQMLQAKGQAPAAPDAAAYGAMGVDPSAFMQPTPPVSPFQEQQQPAPTPPATGFGAGASPFGFAGPGSMSGVNPANFAPPAPAPAPIPAPQVAAAPSTVNRPAPAPAANLAADDGEEDTPAAAKPTQGVMPGAPQSQAAPFSLAGAGAGAGDRLMKATRGFMGNMGAGPIGALMGGLGALVTGSETDPTSIAQQKMNATGQALLDKGASISDVRAAVNNPALMTALLAQYYGKDKYKVQQVGETPMGKTFKMFNESDGTFKDIPGNAGGTGADGSGGGFSMPENFDPKTRRDEAFIKSLDPVTRQVVDAAYNGDNVPQGRNLQKYMPIIQRAIQGFDPSSYLARQSFNREMGSGKAGYGMQASGFQQSLEHLDTLAQRYLKKGNVNGFGFPDVAHIANAASEHFSNDQAGDAIAIANEGQQAAGEVGKLFSGSQGGGVHEREATKSYLGNTRASGPEAAAGIESTLDLMMGGLSKLEQARDRAYDGNAPAKYNFLGDKQQQQIDRIRAAITQLKTGAASPSAAPAAAAPGASLLQPGQSTKIGNVAIRRVN